jgi:hypothetical protein
MKSRFAKVHSASLCGIVLAFTTACGGPSEKAALAAFDKAGKEVEAWVDAKQKEMTGGPSSEFMKEMLGKIKGIPTKGLPEDLKSAFDGVVSSMEKMTDGMKDLNLPSKQEEMAAFWEKKVKEDPEFMKNFQAKMETLGKDSNAASKKMEELAKKYGLEAFAKKK